jgi:hypothetical protein
MCASVCIQAAWRKAVVLAARLSDQPDQAEPRRSLCCSARRWSGRRRRRHSLCLCQRLPAVPGRWRAPASPCSAPPAAGSTSSGDCCSGPQPQLPYSSQRLRFRHQNASRQRVRWPPGTDCMENVAVSNCQPECQCIASVQHGLYAVY